MHYFYISLDPCAIYIYQTKFKENIVQICILESFLNNHFAEQRIPLKSRQKLSHLPNNP